MSKITEYLAELGIHDDALMLEYITRSDIKTIHSLVLHIRDLIDNEYVMKDYTPFTFVPNSDISGAGGCDEMSCKIKRASNFSVFSALYADRVYIRLDFITSEHYELHDIDEIESCCEMSYGYKDKVKQDLFLILEYYELIEKGIICITPARHMICMDCFQKALFGTKNHIDISELKSDYAIKAKVVLREFDGDIGYAAVGIENVDEFFPDHDMFWNITNPESLTILSKEKEGSEIKNKVFANEFVENFIEEEIMEACHTAIYCHEQSARLITNKASDSMFFGMNTNNNLNHLENQFNLLPKYLMPIVKDLSLENLIRLREEENESFNKYRIALSKAINERAHTNSERDIMEIYDDIIFPEINNLNMKLKQLKQGNLRRFFGTLSIITTVIVANRFGNMINPSLLSATLPFGVAIGANFVLDKLANKKANLRDNDFYFLWKLKQGN